MAKGDTKPKEWTNNKTNKRFLSSNTANLLSILAQEGDAHLGDEAEKATVDSRGGTGALSGWCINLPISVAKVGPAIEQAMVGKLVQRWQETLDRHDVLVCISKQHLGILGAWAFLIVKVTGCVSSSQIDSIVVWGGGGSSGKSHHAGLDEMIERFKRNVQRLLDVDLDA